MSIPRSILLVICGLALSLVASDPARAQFVDRFTYYVPMVVNDQLGSGNDGVTLTSYLVLENPTASTITWNYRLFHPDGQLIRQGDCDDQTPGHAGPYTLGPFQVSGFGDSSAALDDIEFPDWSSAPVCVLGDTCGDGPYACDNDTFSTPCVAVTCPNKASIVVTSDSPLIGHLHVAVDPTPPAVGPSEADDNLDPGMTLEIQSSTATRLRLPHVTLDGRDPSCASPNNVPSTRWPVLFLQNPSNPDEGGVQGALSAAGCIRLIDEAGSATTHPFSIVENGTLVWEVGASVSPVPCATVRYSIEVDTTDDCGSGKGGSVVGALYTFVGPDWDIGEGMDVPVFVEIPAQLDVSPGN